MSKITYEQYTKVMHDIVREKNEPGFTPSFDYLDFSFSDTANIVSGLRNPITRSFIIDTFVEDEKIYRIYPKVTKEDTCLQYIGLINEYFYFYSDDDFEREGGLSSLVKTEFSSSDIIGFGGENWLNENGLYKREY